MAKHMARSPQLGVMGVARCGRLILGMFKVVVSIQSTTKRERGVIRVKVFAAKHDTPEFNA